MCQWDLRSCRGDLLAFEEFSGKDSCHFRLSGRRESMRELEGARRIGWLAIVRVGECCEEDGLWMLLAAVVDIFHFMLSKEKKKKAEDAKYSEGASLYCSEGSQRNNISVMRLYRLPLYICCWSEVSSSFDL